MWHVIFGTLSLLQMLPMRYDRYLRYSMYNKRDICSFQLTLQSNNANKIRLKKNKNQPLGQHDNNGHCL